MSETLELSKTLENLDKRRESQIPLTEKDVTLLSYLAEASPMARRNKDAHSDRFGVSIASIQQVKHTGRTSSFATLMHLLKGNIGTGILAMPNAVSNAGLTLGSFGIPILGAICCHCMHLLVISSRVIAIKLGATSLDYSTTAEQAFRFGPPSLRFIAPIARYAVNIMLMFTQLGFCCVYFLFVSSSLYEVSENLFGTSPFSIHGYMLLTLPFMVLFNFIRSLKRLSIASSVANVLLMASFVMMFYFLLQGNHSTNLYIYTAPVKKLPLYFGTVMYAFEGIGVVLPLQNAMKTPEDFGGLSGVLTTGMVIVICLYTAVGFYGYLKYGNYVKASITFNLPSVPLSELIRLTFAVAVFLTYALQFYVPLSIIWSYLKEKFQMEGRCSSKVQTISELLLRTFLVFITCIMAIAIPNLELLISLVGALASSSLALIFPPIIELVTSWNTCMNQRKMTLIIIKDVAIILFGIFGCFIGTYTTVKEIVHQIREPS